MVYQVYLVVLLLQALQVLLVLVELQQPPVLHLVQPVLVQQVLQVQWVLRV